MLIDFLGLTVEIMIIGEWRPTEQMFELQTGGSANGFTVVTDVYALYEADAKLVCSKCGTEASGVRTTSRSLNINFIYQTSTPGTSIPKPTTSIWRMIVTLANRSANRSVSNFRIPEDEMRSIRDGILNNLPDSNDTGSKWEQPAPTLECED